MSVSPETMKLMYTNEPRLMFPFQARADFGEMTEITEWCAANLSGECVSRFITPGKGGLFEFENEQDAIWFRIRWSS
jgi:L-fucose isomerase-like protein